MTAEKEVLEIGWIGCRESSIKFHKSLLVLLKLNGEIFESHLRSTLVAFGHLSLSPDICTSVRHLLLWYLRNAT